MATEPIVLLENARIFQQEFLILPNVNLKIFPGEFVYLIGKTGSGKSSLLKTLYGDLKLKKGSGAAAGYNLENLSKNGIPYLRRKIGIVFQDFQLLTDRTVSDNLRFVMKATGWKNKDLINKRVEEVLSLVGLATKDFKMPHELSGGEQQRVVVARALLNDPMIILADEPTGNLDPDTSNSIIELLFKIKNEEGTSILMATHDYRIIEKYPSRVIKIENGKIADYQSNP